MWTKTTTFLCLALCYQVYGYPYVSRWSNDYGDYSRGAYVQAPEGQRAYYPQSRPGGPITGLISGTLNTIGQFVGDLGGAVGKVLGGTLGGLGQFGQDVQDFLQPISVGQVAWPDPNQGPAYVLPGGQGDAKFVYFGRAATDALPKKASLK